MRLIKAPTAEQQSAAKELITKQIEDGERITNAPPKEARTRVSAQAYRDAEVFFNANQLGRGPKPSGVAPESIKELMAAGVLRRDGHARGTTYVLLKRPNDLFRDDRLTFKPVKPTAGAPRASWSPQTGAVITIGATEKAYIRENVREYLAFATSLQARKHEEKRQSENILDLMNTRAKEILKASRDGVGPRITPLDAARQAQVEIALDFEQLLRVKWQPIMFEIFGMEETADTDMRTMRR